MRIGLAFDLKADVAVGGRAARRLAGRIRQSRDHRRDRRGPARIGHTVVELGERRELVEKLLPIRPIWCSTLPKARASIGHREARVPAVCEMLGVPYVGSDPLTLAATLDKDVGRRLAASHGVRSAGRRTRRAGISPA